MHDNTPDTHGEAPRTTAAAPAPTLEDAFVYAELDLPIVPLARHTKHPPKGFIGFQDRASTDLLTIRDWWRAYPHANIGHIIQPGYMILDKDVHNRGDVGLHNLLARHGDLPATTWHVWSGSQDGSEHLWYRIPEDVEIPYFTSIEMGVEILGHLHLVVLPPSLHPDTGKLYTWDPAYNPFTMPAPAMAPDWLLHLVLDVHAKKSSGRARGGIHTREAADAVEDGVKPPEDGYAEGATKVPKGFIPPGPPTVSPPQSTLVDAPGKHLVAMACDPKHLPAMLKACALPETLEVGWSTRCPFHDDEHPSASLLGPTAEHHSYGLYCHASACKRYYSLLDIFKAKTSANLLSIHTEIDARGRQHDHAPLRLQWLTRLLEAAGILHLVELGAPSLPPDATEVEKAVWSVALHTRRVRSATRKAFEAFALSWRFVKDWLGQGYELGQYEIQKAKCRLIARGLLERHHTEDGITYWRIGDKARRRAMRDAPIFPTEQENVANVDATPVPEPVDQTSPCPYADVRDAAFSSRHCEYCLQAYLDNKRAQLGVWIDPRDPYGLGALARIPT